MTFSGQPEVLISSGGNLLFSRILASGLLKFYLVIRASVWDQVVGLGGFELPTSPLSGVRSNQLSYRPGGVAGGAERDRTDDLLNANQALSQLSYSPV